MATAKTLLRTARAHLGEAYVLGVMVPKRNADWRGPWDCAEFASWCVYQVSGVLFGCRPRKDPDIADAYSGFWLEDSARVGKAISIGEAAATPGAFLIRAPQAGAVGHVVICAGGGQTVEAHSTKRGVIESTAEGRRWTTGVLVPGIDVTVAAATRPPERPTLVLRVTKPAMKGEIVRRVQRRLKALGYEPGPADGMYGPQTAAAVQAFQMIKGLLPDGEVGSRTAKSLGVDWY